MLTAFWRFLRKHVIGLLRRGVEIYYLRRLTLIKKKREELRLSKTARGDIKTLMSIDERWFRSVSEDFLIMRKLISMFRMRVDTHQRLANKYRSAPEVEKNRLNLLIKSIEEQMDDMAKEIAEEAEDTRPSIDL